MTPNSVGSLYLFINKINCYIVESHENKSLIQVSAVKNKRHIGKTFRTMG